MVLIILTISIISIGGYLVTTSVLSETLRLARAEMESGAGRHRYISMASKDASGDGRTWQHANNNRPVSI